MMDGTMLFMGKVYGKSANIKSPRLGGGEGIRTPDPVNAIHVLYQLSYTPTKTGTLVPFRGAVYSISASGCQ